MFTRHKHGLHTMSALWLLPVVPACVAANTAGVLASKMDDAGQALTVFYIGDGHVERDYDLGRSCELTTNSSLRVSYKQSVVQEAMHR
jgi:hypothetical protein